MPEDKGLASAVFLELKDTSLAHGHWVDIFEAVNNATFDAMGGITNFILKDWLGNIDPPSREVPVKIPSTVQDNCKVRILTLGLMMRMTWI